LTSTASVSSVGTRAYPDLGTALKGVGSSGVAFKVVETSGKPALDAAHEAALAAFAQPDGSCHIGATFRTLLAERLG
jgi:hypothetical protein